MDRITRRRFLTHEGLLLLGAGIIGVAGIISSCAPMPASFFIPDEERKQKEGEIKRTLLGYVDIVRGPEEINIADFTDPRERYIQRIVNVVLSAGNSKNYSEAKIIPSTKVTGQYKTPFDALSLIPTYQLPGQYLQLNDNITSPKMYFILNNNRVDILLYDNYGKDNNLLIPFEALVNSSFIYDIIKPNKSDWAGETRKDDWDRWAQEVVESGRVIENKNLAVPPELLIFQSELMRLLGESAGKLSWEYFYSSSIPATYLMVSLGNQVTREGADALNTINQILDKTKQFNQQYNFTVKMVGNDGQPIGYSPSFIPLESLKRVTQWNNEALEVPVNFHPSFPSSIQATKQVEKNNFPFQFVFVKPLRTGKPEYLFSTRVDYSSQTEIKIPIFRPTPTQTIIK